MYGAVGMAGALGALCRWMIGLLLDGIPSLFPFATLGVNLAGSFLLGYLTSGYLKKTTRPLAWKMAVGTGFIGSFTTFSTFSLETVQLLNAEQFGLAFIYILVSMFGGLLLALLGYTMPKHTRKGEAS